jgi:predicted dithiol-disulfide oxidoreductase (DUF899 family)
MWIDGFNGVAQHIVQNIDFVIVAAASPKILRDHARNRGWYKLRLLSAGRNTFKHDLGSEGIDGNQDSALSVFTHDLDGTPRHFYTTHPRMGPEINQRGIDLLTPVWNIMDMTPQGRGKWFASLAYGTRV